MQVHRGFSLLACVIMNGQVWGNAYSYNVLYVHLLNTYNSQSLHASLIGSLIFGIVMFLPIVVTPLMMRLSPRILYVIGCLIGGTGPVLSSLVTDLRLWYITFVIPIGVSGSVFFSLGFCLAAVLYPKHSAIVCSLVSGSTGLFTLFVPSLWEVGMSHIGFHNTLYAYSAFFGLMLTITWSLPARYGPPVKKREVKAEEVVDKNDKMAPFASAEVFLSINTIDEDRKQMTSSGWRSGALYKAICHRNIIVWTVANVIACIMLYSPFVHIMKYAKSVLLFSPSRPPPPDFPKEALTTAVSVAISIGSISSKIIFALLAHRRCLRPVLLFQCGLVIFGAAQTALSLAQYMTNCSFYAVLCVFVFLSFLIGVGEGPYFALLLPTTDEVSGPGHDPIIFSFVCSAISFPLVTGGPIGERLHHLTGNYLFTFLIGGLFFFAASLLMFFIKPRPRPQLEFELVPVELN